MPDAYDLHEGRFIQQSRVGGSVNNHTSSLGPVPAGKVWTIISAECHPDADETQYFWFSVLGAGPSGYEYPITFPTQLAVDFSESEFIPLLREGMELKLYPGEYIRAHRQNHTAGSTLYITVRYIESDLPYYHYEEPQKKVIQRMIGHRTGGATATARGSTTEAESAGREGKSGPERI